MLGRLQGAGIEAGLKAMAQMLRRCEAMSGRANEEQNATTDNGFESYTYMYR